MPSTMSSSDVPSKGVKACSPHDSRHSFVTQLLRQDKDLLTVQRLAPEPTLKDINLVGFGVIHSLWLAHLQHLMF
jgi:site-specific recombinase XerC